MTVIHCQSTAERDSRKNKTATCRPNAENPRSFSISLRLSSPERATARARWSRERDGGRRPASRRCGTAWWPAHRRATFTRRWVRHRRAGSQQCPKPRSGRTTLGCCRWTTPPPTKPLADARRSPEGECAAVEPSHGGALLWRSEPTHGGCAVARCPSRSPSRWSKMTDPTWRRGKTPTSLGLGFGFVWFLFDLKAKTNPLLLLDAGT
jgi:hypothetical protein